MNRLLERIDFRLNAALLEIMLQLELIQRLCVGRNVYQGIARLFSYRAHFLSCLQPPYQEESFLTTAKKIDNIIDSFSVSNSMREEKAEE